MDTESEFKYDAAISFLNPDLGTAQLLRDGLSPQLRVFLYADRQEELAGSDGLATFRAAFRSDSKLVVVLFRAGWGETPWTRVEQQAIEERFLKEGPEFLFFIMLDESSPPPWLPEHRIRFSLEHYGIDQAVGAIKFRLQEIGASFRRETALDRAVRSEEIARFNEETKRLKACDEGVRQAAQAATSLVDMLEKTLTEIRDTLPGLKMEVGRAEESIVGRTVAASLEVAWINRYINVLDKDSYISFRLFRSQVILPGKSECYSSGEAPTPQRKYRFTPERIKGLGWCWSSSEQPPKTSPELADYAVQLLLEQIERKGE